jgi:hypothetical protein
MKKSAESWRMNLGNTFQGLHVRDIKKTSPGLIYSPVAMRFSLDEEMSPLKLQNGYKEVCRG